MNDDILTVTEACVVLRVSVETLHSMLTGPNNPDLSNVVTLRQALACKVLLDIEGLLTLDATVRMATQAARDADPLTKRLMIAAAPDGKAFHCWRKANAPLLAPAKRPFIAVPADQMMIALSARLSEHRAATRRPH